MRLGAFTFGDDMSPPPLVDAAQGDVAPVPPPPPPGYLWPDGYYHADLPPQQASAYQQPGFWVDLFGNAVQRALAVQQQQRAPVVYTQPLPPLWLVVGGSVVAVLVIRAMR